MGFNSGLKGVNDDKHDEYIINFKIKRKEQSVDFLFEITLV
jgi:hypothetical protein